MKPSSAPACRFRTASCSLLVCSRATCQRVCCRHHAGVGGCRALPRPAGALVKRLSAVETLGSTDVIRTDKTGTLTKNRMRPVAAWTPSSEMALDSESVAVRDAALAALAQTASTCNNATLAEDGKNSGDPTEVAVLLAARALGADTDVAVRERGRSHQYNFDAQRKLMSTIDADGERHWVHTKGAPEMVLPRCVGILSADGEQLPLGQAERERIQAQVASFAENGLRVLALARRSLAYGPQPPDRELAERELCFLGLVCMRDPPRPEVFQSVERCHHAGIRIVLISGDHPLTAAAIARQVGIGGEHPQVVNAQAFDHTHEQEMVAALSLAGFFYVLTRAGWHEGDPVGVGDLLHHAYLQATTMTFLGMIAGQIGTAFAVRTRRASLFSIGVFSNRYLLYAILAEIALAAIFVYTPPMQSLLGTAALPVHDLLFLLPYPLIVWGADEIRRFLVRRHTAAPVPTLK
jgi:YD repeat-containing protein